MPLAGPAQTVVAREMAYVPIEVKGVVGRPVTIQLKNEGLLEHDFNVLGIRASGVKAVDAGVSSAHGSAHGSAPEAVHVAAGPGKTSTLTLHATGSWRIPGRVFGPRPQGGGHGGDPDRHRRVVGRSHPVHVGTMRRASGEPIVKGED